MGSGQLADGLGTAAGSAPALEDGARRLSAEGTSQLAAAGNTTAIDFGQRYALIEASAERTAGDAALPFGAPEDAVASAAYSYDLAPEEVASSSNWTRGIAAAVIFAAAGAVVFFLARRTG